MSLILFALVCGLLGESVEVSRLRLSGIAMPGPGLLVTLFVAYAGLGAICFAFASMLADRRVRLAAAFFGVVLLLPWANFELLPAAGSLTSIVGSALVALGAAALGWLVALFPRAAGAGVGLLAVLANFPSGSGGGSADVGAAAAGKPNLLVILVDTLRADHLGVYGYHRPTSPRIDALARQGIRFERAVAQASWTKPSVASLFTGRFVHAHGVIRSLDALGEDLPTLAEALDRAGYRTAAFSANPWITPEFRFSRGFDHFESGRAMGPQLTNLYRAVRRGESLFKKVGVPLPISRWVFRWAGRANTGNAERDEAQMDAVVDWVRKVDPEQPFFLYVHMIGPHDPYDPPEEFSRAFARSSEKARRLPPPRVQTTFEEAEALDPAALERLVDQYDAAIAHSDSLVGRLLDQLDASGLADDTIVILTSDHGEEFYEHRNWRHGNQLYDEVVRVPLLVRIPGGEAGVVRRDPAMLVDILPTALALLEVEASSAELDGRALFPAPAGVDQATFSEHWWFEGGTYVSQAVSQAGLKLKSTRDEGRGRASEELYDLNADRRETENLLMDGQFDESELDRLRSLIARLGGDGVRDGGGSLDEIDPVTRERLERLGYFDEEKRK